MKYRFLTWILILAGPALSAQPAMEIPSKKFDFGYIPDQSTVRHAFWFKAVGNDTVRIQEIKTGCKCTVVPLTRKWLAPGDSMLVDVFWDLGRRIGNTGQYPAVLLESQADPLYMSLIGQVVDNPDQARPVSIAPYKAELARTAGLSIDSVGFVLTNHADQDLTLTVVSRPMQECELSFPKTLEAGAQVTGYIKLNREYSDAEFKGSVTLEFEGEKKNRLTIPVRRKTY